MGNSDEEAIRCFLTGWVLLEEISSSSDDDQRLSPLSGFEMKGDEFFGR